MKKGLSTILTLLVCILISFVFIFLFVFFGGHQLFESDNPILQELGASVVVGIIIAFACELFYDNRKKIEKLEERIKKLEEHK